MDRIPVSELLSEQAKPLRLKLIYGKGQVRERYITSFRIQKPGLGLAGYTEHIHGGRVQILGNTEISYLKTLSSEKRAFSISNLARRGLCCFVVTKNLNIPKELLSAVREHGIEAVRFESSAPSSREGRVYASIGDRADLIVNVCKLKTHSLTGLTLAVKNMFGLVPGTAKVGYHREHPVDSDLAANIYDLFTFFKGRMK